MTDRKEQQKHPYLYEKLHIRALLDPVTRRYLLLTAVLAILCLSVFIADLSFVPGLQRETAATQEKLLSLSKRHRDLIRQVDALGEDRIYTILEDFYTPAERRTLFSRVFAYELWINGRRHRKGSEYLRITCPELVIELKERQRIKDGIPAGLADRFRLLSTRPQESGEPDRLWRIDATIREGIHDMRREDDSVIWRVTYTEVSPGEIITIRFLSPEPAEHLAPETGRIEIFYPEAGAK